MAQEGRKRVALLFLLVVLAVILRTWGLDHGLPNLAVRPDEDRIVGPAASVVRQGNFEPTTLVYPSLTIYLNAAVLGLLTLAASPGDWASGVDRIFQSWPSLFFLVGRGLGVAFGAATVFVVHRLARALGLGETGALVAAAVVATNYLHVRDSHWATADAALTFFVALSLLFALQALEDGRGRLVAAGIAAGLAASTKYQGVIALAGPLFAAWSTPTPSGRLRRAIQVGLLAVLAFVLTSPYQVKRWRAVADTVVEGREDVLSRPGERAYSVHARLTLPTGFGWPVMFAALLGLAKAARDRDRRELVTLAFAVPWVMSIANAGWVFPRYVTPLVPPVALWAARGVCGLAAGLPVRAVLLTLVLCTPGLVLSAELGRVLSQPDTRLQAAQWIDERLSGRVRVLSCRPFAELVFERRRARGVSCADGVPDLEWADVIVLPGHPHLAHFVPVSPMLRRAVEASGERLGRFDPFRPEGAEGAGAEFYPGDAFFVPFRGLSAVERGGPVLEVWSLRRNDPTLWRVHPRTP